MKKLATIFMVFVVALSMGACSSNAPAPVTTSDGTDTTVLTPGTNADTAVDLKNKKLAFINAGPDDYYAAFGNAFTAVAKSYGMNVAELNSAYSAEKELANVQDMISAGVDAIAVISANTAGSSAAIAAANSAGVPIFYVGGKPELQAGSEIQGHVTDSFVMMGYMAGQWVSEKYPQAKCVTIPGQLGQRMAEGEVVGFAMALDEAGMTPLKVLASGEWQKEKTVPIMEALIDSGEKFDVVFAANDETAFGVIQVLKERDIPIKQYPDDGKDGIVVVSNNGKDSGWDAMKDGGLAISVPNPPSLSADLCVQQIVKYFSKEPYKKQIQITPSIILDAKNTDKGISWVLDTYMKQRANNVFEWNLSYYEESYDKNMVKYEKFDKAVDDYMAKH
ncbi:ABC-type sugar transport system substrate-binding protein [Anaerobacterium chartisolvens]|uniref:ABC-type sugar transport system substrate-binding protein n=1 Tax=Anaerobacterium chartisolvens TaxID=1297424 RepID=A0A369B531_9FIRM|nr:sugar ABC transporter substrate-binding protein [Anaerobacterium chartisolvens]RCX16551.1 ABC-type sugar transport system substrate-binding protein [Anaerobacterium chartisolvens]